MLNFSRKRELISAKTVIDEKFSFTGWSGDSRKFSIDYNVKMPVWMNLELWQTGMAIQKLMTCQDL